MNNSMSTKGAGGLQPTTTPEPTGILDTGWLNFAAGGSFISGGGAGDVWSNPEFALVSNDGQEASCVAFTNDAGSYYTEMLEAINLAAHGISVDATILGFEAKVRRTGSSGSISDRSVRANVFGSAVGDEKADTPNWSQQPLYQEVIYGGPTDLWGIASATIMSAINANQFGFMLSSDNPAFSTSRVDHMQMRIYYE